ncbi:MAG: glycoside hydrolase family 5 protein [Bacilli bacterium]|nr:glycoside hydrolase family 5 protein [Bacilli bacterium]
MVKELKVVGTNLVDIDNKQIMLKGISNHGLSWYPQYVNKETMSFFKKDFNINAYRLAMYTYEENGYCICDDEWRQYLLEVIDRGVKAAIDLDMYIIIDWHILYDSNPLTYLELAKGFFGKMAQLYGNIPNVIFEICNEPNKDCDWNDIKKYSNIIIPIIRKYSNNIIVVGTPTWSQDVDLVCGDALEYQNIMYALHFYSSTHKDDLRQKLECALKNGLPVFISEFGVVEASGNGFIDHEQYRIWFDLIKKYNLSHFCWNLSNRDEASAILKPNINKLSNFTDEDYNEAGLIYKYHFIND